MLFLIDLSLGLHLGFHESISTMYVLNFAFDSIVDTFNTENTLFKCGYSIFKYKEQVSIKNIIIGLQK